VSQLLHVERPEEQPVVMDPHEFRLPQRLALVDVRPRNHDLAVHDSLFGVGSLDLCSACELGPHAPDGSSRSAEAPNVAQAVSDSARLARPGPDPPATAGQAEPEKIDRVCRFLSISC